MDRSTGMKIDGAVRRRVIEAKPKPKAVTPTRATTLTDWLAILPESDTTLRPALEKRVERKKLIKKHGQDDGAIPQDRGGRRSTSGETVNRDGKVTSDRGSE